MKITFITTTNHNVGDDFVREGIIHLIHAFSRGKKHNFSFIHKHSPITSRYGFEWIRNTHWSQRLDNRLPYFSSLDRIGQADMLIQSGAPVYWLHEGNTCNNNEWYIPLIKKRYQKKTNVPLLNIAAGAAQNYYSDGSEFLYNDEVKSYICEFAVLASITTVRDNLSKAILKSYNIDVPAIPCTSIFSSDSLNIKKETGEYVVMNYMENGGHYTFSQNINSEKWKNTFIKLYDFISSKENVILVAHNEKELNEARKILPQAKVFHSKNYSDYISFYSKAKLGIMNRVHGAFAMASLGIPSVIIGSDSRARMGEMMGITNYFVEDATYDKLEQDYLYLISNLQKEYNQLQEQKIKAKEAYKNVFKDIF